VILLCKETCGQKFESYRLVGGGQAPGVILRTCADAACKRTVLAFTNLQLLDFAVTTMTEHPDVSMSFLRGNGGQVVERISKNLELVAKVYKFWTGKISLNKLPGFDNGGGGDDDDNEDEEEEEEEDEEGEMELREGSSPAWLAFVVEVEARELTDHSFAISFVNKYKGSTPSTIAQLRTKLKLGTGKRKRNGERAGASDEDDAEHANEECTIQLSTVHGAKGLEWTPCSCLTTSRRSPPFASPMTRRRATRRAASGARPGPTRCSTCGKWIRPRPRAQSAARAHISHIY
jgi:hypothetical protein